MLKDALLVMNIDDDEDDLGIFSELLSRADRPTKLITALSPFQALQMLEETNVLPDIIFMDLNMPGMNGKECLTRIRASPRLQAIPIVMHTSSNVKNDIAFFKQFKAGYLQKGTDVNVMVKQLSLLLDEVAGFEFP